MYHPVDRLFLYCALKLNVAFEDEYGALHHKYGTGFMLVHLKGGGSYITNRHVVDAGYSDARRRAWKIRYIIINGIRLDGRVFEHTIPIGEIRFPSSYDEDVALLTPQSFYSTEKDESAAAPTFSIHEATLANESYFNEMNPGDFVVFSGYPELADSATRKPIMRSGMLSSDPSSKYTGPGQTYGARRIAYEAFSFSGSSGSPVFARACGFHQSVGLGGEPNFRPAKLIGVNAGAYKTSKETERTEVQHYAGISYFFKSTIILDLLSEHNTEKITFNC